MTLHQKTTVSLFYPERNHIADFPATGRESSRVAFSVYHCMTESSDNDQEGIVVKFITPIRC